MNTSQVICIGEALIDQIIKKTDGSQTNYLGGAPANVTCALTKLNVSTVFIGCVGKDKYGEQFKELFNSLNVDINLLQYDKESPTRIVKVLTDENGERSFSGFKNSKNGIYADQMLNKEKIQQNNLYLDKLYINAQYIVVGTLLLASRRSAEALSFLIKYSQKFDLKIVIDLNWRDIFWDNSEDSKHLKREDQLILIKNFLDYADILKLAKEEAILLFGIVDPVSISKSFPKSPDVIITDGSNPIVWFINGLFDKNDVIKSMQIVDSTGAGDAFLAALVSQFLKYSPNMNRSVIKNMIQFASIAGFLNCLGEGAIEKQPTFNDIQKFLSGLGS